MARTMSRFQNAIELLRESDRSHVVRTVLQLRSCMCVQQQRFPSVPTIVSRWVRLLRDVVASFIASRNRKLRHSRACTTACACIISQNSSIIQRERALDNSRVFLNTKTPSTRASCGGKTFKRANDESRSRVDPLEATMNGGKSFEVFGNYEHISGGTRLKIAQRQELEPGAIETITASERSF